ncbi:nuclear factor 7, brain [Microcaecilia unicolor]|uniref:Nuclear factor 7, brain-like n=1 Tax=Microcaecilia unicolor TaxID=1415580 RepID=A0A6P7XKK6_9AMPH|nr:nuclear factor 7, brain-like [Microcaecilia unicolor]XP_030051185.1 nuclear factor 7, brain-like [Microcaecilia unicolor]
MDMEREGQVLGEMVKSCAVLVESLSDEVTCPICLQFFQDPVRLECEHNFCLVCITRCWECAGSAYTCPLCRETCPQLPPKSNRLLASIAERVRSLRVDPVSTGTPVCAKHEEKLKLYCEDDEEPLCVVCGVSKEHKGHRVTPLHEAAELIKEKLWQGLLQLEKQRESVQDAHAQQQVLIQNLKEEASKLREHILSEYQKLRKFLEEEEEALLVQLQAEEQRILGEMQKVVQDLHQEKTALGQEIQRYQDKLAVKDMDILLKDLVALKDRCSQGPREWSVVSEALSHGVFKGPLQYAAWKKMRSLIHPAPADMTFDPLSANPYLVLSEDGTSARYCYTSQPRPESPRRFAFCACVLACQGFSSGCHYWEVEVGDQPDWDIGVAQESVDREGWLVLTPDNGYWTFGQVACSTVGVYLDYEAGRVSFYDAEMMEHLHTLTGSFSEKLYPFFFPSGDCKAKPLRLLRP